MRRSSAKFGAEVVTGFAAIEAIGKAAKSRQLAVRIVKAGAKVVQASARAKAPRGKTGLLKKAIGMKAVKGTRGKTLAFAVIGARSKVEGAKGGKTVKPSKYAHLVERGTKPHSLVKRAKKADVAGWAAREKLIAAGGGKKHPGATPKPFLGPALQSSKAAAGRAMERVAEQEIWKYASGKKDRRGGKR